LSAAQDTLDALRPLASKSTWAKRLGSSGVLENISNFVETSQSQKKVQPPPLMEEPWFESLDFDSYLRRRGEIITLGRFGPSVHDIYKIDTSVRSLEQELDIAYNSLKSNPEEGFDRVQKVVTALLEDKYRRRLSPEEIAAHLTPDAISRDKYFYTTRESAEQIAANLRPLSEALLHSGKASGLEEREPDDKREEKLRR
jgi:hypothetical protein